MFPPQTSLWGRWSPVKERTILLGISSMISLFGNVFATSLTVIICEKIGWEWTFYIYSIFGMFFSIVWVLYFRNSPQEMESVTQVELMEIEKDRELGAPKIPLKVIYFVMAKE